MKKTINHILEIKKLLFFIENKILNDIELMDFGGTFTFEDEIYKPHVNIEELEYELISGFEDYDIMDIEEIKEKYYKNGLLEEEEIYSFEYLYSIKSVLENSNIELELKKIIYNNTIEFIYPYYSLNDKEKIFTREDIFTLKNHIIKNIENISVDDINNLKENLDKYLDKYYKQDLNQWFDNLKNNLSKILEDIEIFKYITNSNSLRDFIDKNINNFPYANEYGLKKEGNIRIFLNIRHNILLLQNKNYYQKVGENIEKNVNDVTKEAEEKQIKESIKDNNNNNIKIKTVNSNIFKNIKKRKIFI